jgi:hypothetical protein
MAFYAVTSLGPNLLIVVAIVSGTILRPLAFFGHTRSLQLSFAGAATSPAVGARTRTGMPADFSGSEK